MVPDAFILTPHIFHGLIMHLNSKIKCGQQVACISLSQLHNVASKGVTDALDPHLTKLAVAWGQRK